ncbi:MAG: hypothetical protein HY808_07435 [Nitrospirae bacterium]|nr:hypothetical protein [Nitrospirota bacterium]
MIDAGYQCEPSVMERVSILAQHRPDQWDSELLKEVQGASLPYVLNGDANSPTKFLFGSSFPYIADEEFGLSQRNTKCTASYAQGGLSNVWGAAVLPYAEDDFAGWPFSLAEMEPHYKAVAQFMEIAGGDDDLQVRRPFYAPPNGPVALSQQAQFLLENMRQNQERLKSKGFRFGRSRLAVRTQPDLDNRECQLCAQCLTGCPYGAIYSSSQSLSSLLNRKNFHYRQGYIVVKVTDNADGVCIVAHDLRSSANVNLTGKRVFLASGTLSTVKVAAASLELSTIELKLRYQPYFLLPLLSYRNFKRVEMERLHTLAQIFAELNRPDISPYPIHIQLYTYNEMMKHKLRQVLRRFSDLSSFIQPFILGRLLAIQGYLHSNCAEGILLQASWQGVNGKVKMSLQSQSEAVVRNIIAHVVWELALNSNSIGAFSLIPLLKIGVPGDGNHIGAVFPMKRDPEDWESDIYGRIRGWQRIHVVDASVMPTLPAPTLTYTVMANAHRIASKVAVLDV